MPIRARTIAGLALAVAVTGAVAVSGSPTASAARTACSDVPALSSAALASCIPTLRLQAESAGRDAARADEAYLSAQQATAAARRAARRLGSAADRAAVAAATSRARVAVVAAQLARTGGSIGQTTQVLFSGGGASETLYHLSRMSELTSGSSTIAADARRNQVRADGLSRRAALAAARVVAAEQRAKVLYRKAKQASETARLLVVKAEALRPPSPTADTGRSAASAGGTAPARGTASVALPADASVGAKVVAFARAQIGEPYVFGAAGPGSWDCSGLTMGAFASVGRNIGGHGVNVQYRLARSRGLLVPYSSAKPGDLLFYGSGDFYHNAIYAGGGTMIEAPYPGKTVREVPVRNGDLLPMVARFTG